MSRILFVHNNFPGQFVGVAAALAELGHDLRAVAAHNAPGVKGIEMQRWTPSRGTTRDQFPAAVRAEADMIRGFAAADAAERLRAQGFEPDLIIGHPGWGETLFLHEVFPGARQISYAEFFYRGRDSDVDFDSEFGTLTRHDHYRLHAKSATLALAYAQADALVSPTGFQGGMLPPRLRAGMQVIHEGVRTDLIKPREEASFWLDDGRVLDRSIPVVTFVSRVLEPMRGFHIFMRALPAILQQAPDAQVLIIGADKAEGYGAAAPRGQTWKSVMLKEVGAALDLSRVHFVGEIAYQRHLDALAVSAAHVYLTYPFTLSWSLVEAMASGCNIVASRTAPVLDALDDETAALVDFFDVAGLAAAIADACADPERGAARRAAARAAAVARFDRETICLPAWLELVRSVLADRDR